MSALDESQSFESNKSVPKTYPKIDKKIEEGVFKLNIDYDQDAIQQLSLDMKLDLLEIVMAALENKQSLDKYQRELERDSHEWAVNNFNESLAL